MEHIYDMIIVGGGPGGYTAALYAARAGLDTVILEKLSAGGQMALTQQIVEENNITCLMITHNIPSALQLGNRTIMMNAGQIKVELSGQQRKELSQEQLLQLFKDSLTTDRVLFG